jgi:hypothetical protein
MAKVEHGFNLPAIRKALDEETWEKDCEEPGMEVRRIYLGSVFSLTPSGKMYTPWAHGNLTPCPTCKGSGRVVPRSLRRRTQKKQSSRHAGVMRRFDALWGAEPAVHADISRDFVSSPIPSLGPAWRPTNKRAAFAFIDRQPKKYGMRSFLPGSSCTACAGLGSREAHLDELWQEAAEEAISSIPGVHLWWEDGDAFACESRDIEEDEEDEGEESTEGQAYQPERNDPA